MKAEASLQASCVKWFNLQYPQHRGLLIHVPNGGSRRSAIEGRSLKLQGVTAGVADLLLLIAKQGYGCLCIELKTAKGKQSESQQAWQKITIEAGNIYIICRTVEEFIGTINSYLNEANSKK